MNCDKFLDQIFENLKKAGIDVSGYECDHIGFRSSSLSDYQSTKEEFSKIGRLVGEAEVVGRPVAIFKLNTPIKYQNYVIPVLELLAPKEGDNYQNGPEHLEFVINESFEEFLKKYSGIEFETHRLERKNNPEVKLKFSDKTSVKFHKLTILKAGALQKQTGEL
jgi:uncharacterized protein